MTKKLFHNKDIYTGDDELLAAYEAVSADIEAVPEGELLPVTVDVLSAVSTVTGVLPGLRSMRPQLATSLPNFDLIRFDRLEQYAQALSLLHGAHRAAIVPKSDVAAMGAELTTVRDRMYSSAMALVECALVDGTRLRSCKTEIGYRALAEDVLILVAVLQDNWTAAQGRTPIELTSLGKWRTQAFELLEAVGLRDKAPPMVGEASLLRQKAFTLVARTYEDARDAVHYLRARAGDADDIAPSLYAGRGSSRRNAKEEPVAAPTPSPASVSNGLKQEEASAPLPFKIDNPLGLPLTSPFSS